MPKLTEKAAQARREHILQAARRCFVRRGFHATTIADICKESGVSAGGLYTWFASKHEIVQALSSQVTERPRGELSMQDLLRLQARLQTRAGGEDAQLDLTLWAEARRDQELGPLVDEAMDEFRQTLKRTVRAAKREGLLPRGISSGALAGFFEALALGLEVQRALNRPGARATGQALQALVSGSWVVKS